MSKETAPFKESLLAAIPNLRAFAISLCGNVTTADDLVQETLLKAWTNHSKFEPGTNLKAWLFTILRNTYFSDFRKTRRELQDGDEAASKLAMPPSQLSHLDFEDMQRALMVLSADQREALLLVGGEGFSYEEAAAVSGCAVGTIKSRVNRGRVKLAELMSVQSIEDVSPERAIRAVVGKTMR